jgi:DNA-binding NtrC family response regulator
VAKNDGHDAPMASGGTHVLIVMSPSGMASIPVPLQGTLVLGRAPECDVRIEDAKLSRRHAELRCGTAMEFVDLGSRNGSYVADKRVTPEVPVAVRAGDAIGIGNTLLTLQRSPSVARPRHLWSHGYFEARLEEECGAAARDARLFAVLRLRLHAERPDDATRDAASDSLTLLTELDGAEMLASYAPLEFEALFVRTSPEEAEARAETLSKHMRALGARFSLIVSAYPRDGRTPEALIEHGSHGVRRRAEERSARVAAPSAASGAIERLEPIVRRVAAGMINVLVLGETGVGKDVLARRLHALSPRAAMPLLAINCGALTESLLESELFGHEKGAFTGALKTKVGLLESANGGTIFLDEVGEMPLATQVKLLRVLENREVTRVGALRPRAIDVRFIAATNRSLEADVAEGRFRRDLFFRLNGIALSLPPLRERVDEIAPLARTFAREACRAMGRADGPRIGEGALAILLSYQWPGNIRELRNVVERAVLLCEGAEIGHEHLPVEKMGPVVEPPPAPREVAAPVAPSDRQARAATLPPSDDGRQRIVEALDACAGNQSQAAKHLGISRATLIRRIAEFNIRRPRKRE